MKILTPFLLIGLLLSQAPLSGQAFAGEASLVELKDGSRFYGEVLSLKEGTYTIQSESMGTIKIDESRILSIQKKTDCEGCEKNRKRLTRSDRQHLSNLQRSMMGNQELMEMIQSLQFDPEFMRMLQDPEVMRSLMAGDVAGLMENPNFMKLKDNPNILEIQKKMSEIKPPPQ